jgi:hypothetical protein
MVKRGVFDTLRRALDNTIANWPVILLRLGEALLFGLLAILTAISIIVPIALSIGIQFADLVTPDDLANAILTLGEKWIIFVWIFVAIMVLLLLFLLVHSFVEAGCARIAIDADRIGGPAVEGPRMRFRVFSMERWMAGGIDGWWTLFWIYNFAWGLAGLVMLLPLIPTGLLMLLLWDTPEVAAGLGCFGLVVSAMFVALVAIVTGIWTNRAIAGWAVRRHGARDALAAGWRALELDFARHILIALSILVVAIAGSSFFASFSFFAMFGDSWGSNVAYNVVVMPLRIFSSILSSAFSAAISQWYLASYGALAVEESGQ